MFTCIKCDYKTVDLNIMFEHITEEHDQPTYQEIPEYSFTDTKSEEDATPASNPKSALFDW